MKKHHYKACISWTGNRGEGTKSYQAYERDHDIIVEGKRIIEASSDPAFKGSPKRHNPEDLFLSSVASCHMLWYLHLCSVNDIVVVSYVDNTKGIMLENSDGSGKFTEIILQPEVVVEKKEMIENAMELHHKANKMCFIANSLNIKVEHISKISSRN